MDAVRTIEIDAEAEAQLREIAAERGLEPREMVEGFIAEEAAAQKIYGDMPVAPGTEYPATPEAFAEAIREARESVEREGWVDGREVSAWLKAKARGEHPELPKPRKDRPNT